MTLRLPITTGNSKALRDVHKYDGEQNIQIVGGRTIPLTAIGNIGSAFTNVFVSPDLSANLISVGQLVENDYSLHFDHHGCRVQDQVSGQVVATGPKVGRLFPLLSFSIPHLVSLGCSSITNTSHLWHKKLGHPNSVILKHLVKSGYLNNIHEFSSHLSFDCAFVKLVKANPYHFRCKEVRLLSILKLFILMFAV